MMRAGMRLLKASLWVLLLGDAAFARGNSWLSGDNTHLFVRFARPHSFAKEPRKSGARRCGQCSFCWQEKQIPSLRYEVTKKGGYRMTKGGYGMTKKRSSTGSKGVVRP